MENQLKGSLREKALLNKMPHKNARNSILPAAQPTTRDHILFHAGQITPWTSISFCLSHHNRVSGVHSPGPAAASQTALARPDPAPRSTQPLGRWTGWVFSCHASYCFPGFTFDFTAMLILLKPYSNHL